MQDSALCCGRLPPCLGLIWLYAFISPGTPVGPWRFNSHYQCPTHVGLPLTVLVAHWPQQGTKHADPLWSQNGSWTIAWHLRYSHEVAKSMSYSVLGNNSEHNEFILFWKTGLDKSDDPLQQFQAQPHSSEQEKNKHTCNTNRDARLSNHSPRNTRGVSIIAGYILMHPS